MEYNIRIDLEDRDGNELIPNSYTEYKILESYVGFEDDTAVYTHRVEVHAEILLRHFHVECLRGRECVGWDEEARQAWWDDVPELGNDDHNIATAIQRHFETCKGPMSIEEIGPEPR
jgi:hypothetical protein